MLEQYDDLDFFLNSLEIETFTKKQLSKEDLIALKIPENYEGKTNITQLKKEQLKWNNLTSLPY